MRSLRRNIMVVAGVLSVAVAAGPTLARSLPFAADTTPTSRTATAPATVGAGAAAGALNRLPVKGKAAMTGYSRTQFGQAWTDDTDRELTRPWGHNGCDTRNDALARDLVEAHLKPGSRCVVASGRLHDRCMRTDSDGQVISCRPCGRSGPFGPLTLHRPVPAHPRVSWSSPRLHVPSPANSRFRENRHRISVPLISPDSLQH